ALDVRVVDGIGAELVVRRQKFPHRRLLHDEVGVIGEGRGGEQGHQSQAGGDAAHFSSSLLARPDAAYEASRWPLAAGKTSGSNVLNVRRVASEEDGVARRSIGEAAKVVIAAVVLGPPLGGIVVMALFQLVPWMATNFSTPLPELGKNLLSVIALAIPISYVV